MTNLLPEPIRQRRELFCLLQEKRRRTLPVDLFERQSQVNSSLDSGVSRIALEVGRRGGKTDFLIWKLGDFAINAPRANLAYIAKTLDSAKSIVWSKFQKMFEGIPGVDFKEGTLEIHFSNHSKIKLYGGDKDPDVIRGMAHHGVVIDEAAHIKGLKYIVEEIVEPTLIDYAGWLVLASTPYGYGPFYEFCHSPHWTYFHWTGYDNPYIPHRELDKMKVKYGENNDVWLQEYMAIPVRHSGLVFSNLRPYPPHVISGKGFEPNPTWQYIIGLDPGTDAPTGFGLFAYDPLKDILYCLKAKNLVDASLNTMEALIRDELVKYPNLIAIVDHHASLVIKELGNRKLPIVPCGTKDRMGSYSRLIARIERERFVIVRETSEDLLTECMLLEWKPARGGENDTNGVIGSDHCVDMTRYANEYFWYKEIVEIEADKTKEFIDPFEKKIMEEMNKDKDDDSWM